MEVCQNILQLNPVIFLEKITIKERCTSVENIVVWFQIKDVFFLHFIISLNFIFNNKAHVTKRKTKKFLKDQPIVIFAIYSESLVVFDAKVLIDLMTLHDW